MTKIRNALDASPNVRRVHRGTSGRGQRDQRAGLSGGPAQCEASGFIVDLAPSVDPNEFASTLPKGADVLAWKTVTSGSSYDPQTFDRLVAGPYVLVTLAPDATAKQIATIKTAPTVVHARELTDAEYLATLPGRPTRRPSPRPLPRVLDLQLKVGVPANAGQRGVRPTSPASPAPSAGNSSCDAPVHTARSDAAG